MYDELVEEKNADPKFTELFDYLSKHTNQSMRSIVEVDFLHSTFQTEQEAGLKLPEWTKNVFPHKTQVPFMLSLAMLSYNETLRKFHTGELYTKNFSLTFIVYCFIDHGLRFFSIYNMET